MNDRTPTLRRILRALAMAWALTLVASTALAQEGSSKRRTAGQPPLGLAAVRAQFTRLDADRDGKLDKREADHGGIEASKLPGLDQDGDAHLSREEFVVLQRQLPANAGRSLAPDLEAESTRIQALWRARADQAGRGERGGPSSRRRTQSERKPVGEFPAPAARDTSRAARGGGERARTGVDRATSRPPASGSAAPVSGPGLARLRRAAGDAQTSSETLEDGARAAQRLLEARIDQRGARARTSGQTRTTGQARTTGSAPGSRAQPVPPAPAAGSKPSGAGSARPIKPTTGSRPKSPVPGSQGTPPDKSQGGRPSPTPTPKPKPSPAPKPDGRGGGKPAGERP